MRHSGITIKIEGRTGCGKQAVIDVLEKYFKDNGYKTAIVPTMETGKTPVETLTVL